MSMDVVLPIAKPTLYLSRYRGGRRVPTSFEGVRSRGSKVGVESTEDGDDRLRNPRKRLIYADHNNTAMSPRTAPCSQDFLN